MPDPLTTIKAAVLAVEKWLIVQPSIAWYEEGERDVDFVNDLVTKLLPAIAEATTGEAEVLGMLDAIIAHCVSYGECPDNVPDEDCDDDCVACWKTFAAKARLTGGTDG
jgi:hypothetical protein